MNNDFEQLAQWRAYRQQFLEVKEWTVVVAYQVQKNRLNRQDVLVRAVDEDSARRIALARYLKMFPRRQQAWVEGVKREPEQL